LKDPVKGFRVDLQKLREDIEGYQIREEVRRVARHIRDFKTELDGIEVEVIDFDETDNSPFARIVAHPNFNGWLRPYNWYKDHSPIFSYSSEIRIFYQSRYVKEFEVTPGVVGIIQVANNAIDLRAPDRKEIISNEKSEQLKADLKKEIKGLLYYMISEGTDDQIEIYQDLLTSELTPIEYKDYLKYTILCDSSRLEELLEEPEKLKRMSVLQILNKLEEEAPTAEPATDLRIESVQINKPMPRGTDSTESRSQNRVGENLPEMKEDKFLYYVEKKEILDYAELLGQAIEFKIPIILIKNKLEIEALKLREDVFHISELDQKVEWAAKVENVGPVDLTEDRASWIFRLISKVMNLEKSPFIIGDILATRTVTFGPIEVDREELIPFGMCDAKTQIILIDRSKLQKSGLRASSTRRLLASDILFIGSNLDTIAHELTHLLYHTEDDTASHYRLQLDVTRKLTETIFSEDFEPNK